jgi:hypothetical protein
MKRMVKIMKFIFKLKKVTKSIKNVNRKTHHNIYYMAIMTIILIPSQAIYTSRNLDFSISTDLEFNLGNFDNSFEFHHQAILIIYLFFIQMMLNNVGNLNQFLNSKNKFSQILNKEHDNYNTEVFLYIIIISFLLQYDYNDCMVWRSDYNSEIL